MPEVAAYTDADARAVAALLSEVPELPSVTEDTFRSFASQSFNHGAKDFRVVRQGADLVAVLTSTLLNPTLRHFRIAVHPRWRRRGIGTELLDIAGDQAPVAAQLQCTSQASWTAAIAFLDGHGFAIAETERLMEHRGPAPEVDTTCLRRATPSDDPDWKSLHEHGYGGRADFTALGDEDIAALRARAGFTAWVAEDGGEVLGIGHGLELEPGEGLIDSIVVRSDARGRGLGKALTAAVLGELFAADMHRVTLNVLATNASAVAAYRRVGFAEYDQMRTYRRAHTRENR